MLSELARKLNQPLTVGNKAIEKRLVLSPMAFLGNVAFRELVQSFGGCGLLFTEMCSAKRIPHENRRISDYFKWRDAELSHLVCQIYGDNPETMACAAKRVENENFFGIDINFGCSGVSICRQNGGAAILKAPNLAAGIVAAIRKAVSTPLFIKYRTGWEDNPKAAVDLAKRFEDAGADALTFHPRVAPDRRSRQPKWEYIGMVKQAVSIPVFGNGDVFNPKDCWTMLQTTGCDAVAIGRIAIAKPWIFAEWTNGLKAGSEIYLDTTHRLARLLVQHFEPIQALKRFKRFIFYFAANFRFGHTLYAGIQKAQDMTETLAFLYRFFNDDPEVSSRPNMNFFN
jgi:tRNA-dihydrouridine synthase B